MTPSSLIVLALLVLIVRQARTGRHIVATHPELRLRPGQRFRTLLMQLLEPALALAVVGSVFVTHMQAGAPSVLTAIGGAMVGVAFGGYRARSTYVAAVPAQHGVILRFSFESLLALGLLLAVKLVAEQNLLPRGGIFPFVLVGLLAFLLAESVTRAGVVVHRYRQASTMSSPSADGPSPAHITDTSTHGPGATDEVSMNMRRWG